MMKTLKQQSGIILLSFLLVGAGIMIPAYAAPDTQADQKAKEIVRQNNHTPATPKEPSAKSKAAKTMAPKKPSKPSSRPMGHTPPALGQGG